MKKLSIVVPCFNEAERVQNNLSVILAFARNVKPDGSPPHLVELVAVDDGSNDATYQKLCELAATDSAVIVVGLVRNFGKESAIYAGLARASGDCAIVLDSDLQHPPSFIPQMVRYWEEGSPVVECVKTNRGDADSLSGIFANGFYGVFEYMTGLDIANHSDFKLLDRRVIDTYLAMPERRRFFRGIIHWCGFSSIRINFEVAEREGGASKWSRLVLLRYAIDNITAFSSKPLTILASLGIVIIGIAVVASIISTVQYAMGISLPGFTTVNILVTLLGGANLFGLGVLGHYVARIYDELKMRPIYLAKQAPINAAEARGPMGKVSAE